MAENYSFFNSKERDRKYNARHWADYFFPLFKSGVFNGDLQVVANGGMSAYINAGYAWIDGYGYHLTDGLPMDLETASGNMNRIDSIVIRLDLTNRWIKGFVKTGSYYSGAAIPPAPEITTTIHEIVLARINVAAGTTEITQDMIEDTRMDKNLCGWVCGAVEQIEFDQIYAQFQAYQEAKADEIRKWVDKFQNDTENELKEWFDNLREQLTEDPAIKLQDQIGILAELTTENKDNLVEAINEVKTSAKIPIKHLLATEEGNPLDATMGKELKDLHDANKSEIDKLNGNFAWKICGKITSSNILQLPNNWKELMVIFRPVATNNIVMQASILKDYVSANSNIGDNIGTRFVLGDSNTSPPGSGWIKVTKTTLQVVDAYWNGKNVLNQQETTVYYK